MKIMTEKEYERRIKAAKAEAFEEAQRRFYESREQEDMRQHVFRRMDDMGKEVGDRLRRIEHRLGMDVPPCETPAQTCSPF